MADMKVETHDRNEWQDKFMQRLPVAYLLLRLTMAFT